MTQEDLEKGKESDESGSNRLRSRSPSRESVESTTSNHQSADDFSTGSPYMAVEGVVVDESYLEEVERLREENQAFREEQQQQKQADTAVLVVTGPNHTRQIVMCGVCLIIVIVGLIIWFVARDSTCTGLPPKESLLSDVATFHGEAFDWISKNDTWVPSINCDDAANYFLERYALAVLYFDTQGIDWFRNDSWISPVSVCKWQHILCDEAEHVVQVNFVKNNVVGTIPSELGLLTSLTQINFDENQLTGTLPSETGKWTNLQGFFFAKNSLTGPIPSEAGRMTSLTKLNVIENYGLSGTLPTEIGMWTAATRLLFHDANFSGPLPSEIGNLRSLTRLDFFNNALTAQLPSEIGILTNVVLVELYNNSFSGTLPSEFGLLNKMERLDLHNNTLRGSLPTELGQVTALENFTIAFNNFSGSIPPLPYHMRICDLAPPGETGNCFSNLANQQNCSVQGNCPNVDPAVLLADHDPLNQQAVDWLRNDTWSPPLLATDRLTYFEQRYALASLWFDTGGENWYNKFNWMNGESICNWHRILCNAMEHVVFVDLVENNLNGPIPTELGLLTTLVRLNLDNNKLSGTLPSEMGLLSNVSGMFIHGNELSGTIPTEWGNLAALTKLNLANNVGLSGNLPTEIGMWTLLTKVELYNNALTGTLPELNALSSLEEFDVRNNRLTGSIPSLLLNPWLNLTNCRLTSSDETGNCFCTDSNDVTRCVIEGNCPEEVNSTTRCDTA